MVKVFSLLNQRKILILNRIQLFCRVGLRWHGIVLVYSHCTEELIAHFSLSKALQFLW